MNSCCQKLELSDISKIATRATGQERGAEGGLQPHRKHLMKQRQKKKNLLLFQSPCWIAYGQKQLKARQQRHLGSVVLYHTVQLGKDGILRAQRRASGISGLQLESVWNPAIVYPWHMSGYACITFMDILICTFSKSLLLTQNMEDELSQLTTRKPKQSRSISWPDQSLPSSTEALQVPNSSTYKPTPDHSNFFLLFKFAKGNTIPTTSGHSHNSGNLFALAIGKAWFRYILWKTASKAHFPPPPVTEATSLPVLLKHLWPEPFKQYWSSSWDTQSSFYDLSSQLDHPSSPAGAMPLYSLGSKDKQVYTASLKGKMTQVLGSLDLGEGGWHVPSALCIHLLSEGGLLHPWLHSVHQAGVMLSVSVKNKQASGHFTESHTIRISTQI